MQDIVDHIQKHFLRDPSPILTPIVTALLERIIQDVWYYHHWSFLLDDVTLSLTTDTETYDLAGNDNDLGKILNIWYGDEYDPLNKVDRTEFRRTYYQQTVYNTPICWYPVKKINDFTWRVRIYPTSASSLQDAIYAYQTRIDYSKIRLFDNPMVFIFGTIALFFANEKKYAKSRKYTELYENRRDEMKRRDSAVIYPVKRIVHPADTKHVRRTREVYRTLRIR